MQLLSCHFVYF